MSAVYYYASFVYLLPKSSYKQITTTMFGGYISKLHLKSDSLNSSYLLQRAMLQFIKQMQNIII